MRLTQKEWWALCAAIAERDANLEARADDDGEATGRERAALDRAKRKVMALAPAGRWDTSRR